MYGLTLAQLLGQPCNFYATVPQARMERNREANPQKKPRVLAAAGAGGGDLVSTVAGAGGGDLVSTNLVNIHCSARAYSS